ncbi:hypothetical protein DITRI_Ditri01bG0015500 [Diplodiscus trichospermus]
MPRQISTNRATSSWSKPPEGYMKFNVDGSAFRKSGPAGIVGILRDHMSSVKIVFSKHIGTAESTELLAVGEAFLLFVEYEWVNSHKIIIESESSNVVQWISSPSSAPWTVRNLIAHIENLKNQLNGWSIVHIFKEANEEADSLAKAGAHITDELVNFYND